MLLHHVPLKIARAALAAVFLGALTAFALPLGAADTPKKSFDISAGDAHAALKVFFAQSGEQLIYREDSIDGVKTHEVQGDFTPVDALNLMFEGTGLSAIQDQENGALSLFRKSDPTNAKPAASDSVTVPIGDNSPVVLSRFEVIAGNETGYLTQQSVSGARSAKNLIDIPSSISIINQEQLADHNASTINDALQFGVAGVTQNSSITDDVNIRGFRSETILRDGLAWTPDRKSELYDVQDIEVIKGPTNMLVGTSSFVGGAINAVTREPTATPQADVKVTLSNDSYLRFAGTLSGPIYQSSDFGLQYRITVGRLAAHSPKEIENQDQKFLGGSLRFILPKARASLTVTGSYLRDQGYAYLEDFLDIRSPIWAKLNPFDTKGFSPSQHKHAKFDEGESYIQAVYLEQLTEHGSVRVQFQGSNIIELRDHPRGITVAADDFTLNRQNIALSLYRRSELGQLDYLHHLSFRDWVTFDTTLGTALSASFTRQGESDNVMPSLDTRNPNFAADDAYWAQPIPGENGQPNNSSDTSSDSLGGSYYAQEYLSFWKDRLTLVGGWRKGFPHGWSESKDFLTNVVTRDGSGVNRIQYKYGIVGKVFPWLSVYATDAANDSYQGSNFIDLYKPDDHLGGPVPDQLGLLKEAGLKLEKPLSDDFLLHFTAARYDVSLTNVNTNGVLPNGVADRIWSARDATIGDEFELGLSYKGANGRVDLIATYATGNSTTTDGPGLQAQDFVKLKYTTWVKYTWLAGPLKGVFLGGGFDHQGQRREYSVYEVKRPCIIDLIGGYDLGKHWNAQLNLDHLENKRYITQIAAPGLVSAEGGIDERFEVEYKF